MNAKFGVVIRADERKRLLHPLPGETRAWGEETYEVGTFGYEYPGLQDVVFEVHSVTHYLRKRLFGDLRTADIEYVSMEGLALDRYEEFLQGDEESQAEVSEFEHGFLSLLDKLSGVAVMFAPEGERLDEYMETSRDELILLLRAHARDVHASVGFLVTLEGDGREF